MMPLSVTDHIGGRVEAVGPSSGSGCSDRDGAALLGALDLGGGALGVRDLLDGGVLALELLRPGAVAVVTAATARGQRE